MGAFHTIDLEPGMEFTLYKQQWDAIFLERLQDATDPARTVRMSVYVYIFVCVHAFTNLIAAYAVTYASSLTYLN
jgi:stalled ribosome rescue protein Dom34